MVDKLIPDVLFISGFALIFLAIVYLPLLLWVLVKLWQKLTLGQIWRALVVFLTAFIALAIPLGDAYLGSLKHERLCKTEGGIHIYKTVEVDGFYSKYLNKSSLDYGYRFAEGKYRGKLYRISRKGSETVWEQINESRSQYIYANEREVLNSSFSRKRHFVANRATGEVLGEEIIISYYGGWMDRYFFLSWLDYRPLQCDRNPSESSVFHRKILIPSGSKSHGETS